MANTLEDMKRGWYLQVLGLSVAQAAKFTNSDLAYQVYSNPGAIGSGGAAAPILSKYIAVGNVAENYSRVLAGLLTGGNINSGRLALQGIYLTAGMVVTSLVYINGNGVGVGQTNLWAALWDPSGNKIAVSQDELTNIVPTITEKVFTLTAPYTVPVSGMYYSSYVWVGSGAVSNLLSTNSHFTLTGLTPNLTSTGATGQTTPALAPSNANLSVASFSVVPYVQVR